MAVALIVNANISQNSQQSKTFPSREAAADACRSYFKKRNAKKLPISQRCHHEVESRQVIYKERSGKIVRTWPQGPYKSFKNGPYSIYRRGPETCITAPKDKYYCRDNNVLIKPRRPLPYPYCSFSDCREMAKEINKEYKKQFDNVAGFELIKWNGPLKAVRYYRY